MSMPMNKFGLEEIRAIRDRWDAMPLEEVRAEQRKLITDDNHNPNPKIEGHHTDFPKNHSTKAI